MHICIDISLQKKQTVNPIHVLQNYKLFHKQIVREPCAASSLWSFLCPIRNFARRYDFSIFIIHIFDTAQLTLTQFSFFSLCILIWFEILWNSVIFLLYYYLLNRPSRCTSISVKVTLFAFEETKKVSWTMCEPCEPWLRVMRTNTASHASQHASHTVIES